MELPYSGNFSRVLFFAAFADQGETTKFFTSNFLNLCKPTMARHHAPAGQLARALDVMCMFRCHVTLYRTYIRTYEHSTLMCEVWTLNKTWLCWSISRSKRRRLFLNPLVRFQGKYLRQCGLVTFGGVVLSQGRSLKIKTRKTSKSYIREKCYPRNFPLYGNSNICRGLQYMHTMLYQRMVDACLGP